MILFDCPNHIISIGISIGISIDIDGTGCINCVSWSADDQGGSIVFPSRFQAAFLYRGGGGVEKLSGLTGWEDKGGGTGDDGSGGSIGGGGRGRRET